MDVERSTSEQSCCCRAKFCWWEPPKESLPLDFCRDTSLHGLKYISQPQRHVSERLFWLFAFLIGMSAAVYLISDAWRKYQENPVIVSFRPVETTIDQIPFPAVTICNMNKVTKSKAEGYIYKARHVDLANSSALSALSNLYFLDHVCSTSKSFSKSFKYSSNVGAVEQELLDLTKELEYALDGSVEQFLRDSSQVCSEMIKLCLWKGEPRDCTELFRPIETDFGKCCTFNMIPTSLLHRFTNDSRDDPMEVEKWALWNQDENWGFADVPEDFEYPKRQLKAGMTSGLSVLLDPDLKEYFCANSDCNGFRISVHQPMDFPHVLDYGHAIEPDTETYVSVRAEITMEGVGLHRVPLTLLVHVYLTRLSSGEKLKYDLNVFCLKGEKTLYYYNYYTSNNCVDECMANLTFSNCSCVRYFMPRKPGIRLCGPQNFECAESVEQRAYRSGVKKICGECLPVCTEIDYHIESSMSTMQSGYNIWVDDANVSASWSDRNVSIVHIYFGQESTYARVRKELVGQTDLIANTGGLLGLCLGFSGLSLMEVLYFITLRLWCRRRRKRHLVTKITNKFMDLWTKTKQKKTVKGNDSNIISTDVKSGWENGSHANHNQAFDYLELRKDKAMEHVGMNAVKFDETSMMNSPFLIITHELQQMEKTLKNINKHKTQPSKHHYY